MKVQKRFLTVALAVFSFLVTSCGPRAVLLLDRLDPVRLIDPKLAERAVASALRAGQRMEVRLTDPVQAEAQVLSMLEQGNVGVVLLQESLAVPLTQLARQNASVAWYAFQSQPRGFDEVFRPVLPTFDAGIEVALAFMAPQAPRVPGRPDVLVWKGPGEWAAGQAARLAEFCRIRGLAAQIVEVPPTEAETRQRISAEEEYKPVFFVVAEQLMPEVADALLGSLCPKVLVGDWPQAYLGGRENLFGIVTCGDDVMVYAALHHYRLKQNGGAVAQAEFFPLRQQD